MDGRVDGRDVVIRVCHVPKFRGDVKNLRLQSFQGYM
jgi:hypothetical protein